MPRWDISVECERHIERHVATLKIAQTSLITSTLCVSMARNPLNQETQVVLSTLCIINSVT